MSDSFDRYKNACRLLGEAHSKLESLHHPLDSALALFDKWRKLARKATAPALPANYEREWSLDFGNKLVSWPKTLELKQAHDDWLMALKHVHTAYGNLPEDEKKMVGDPRNG